MKLHNKPNDEKSKNQGGKLTKIKEKKVMAAAAGLILLTLIGAAVWKNKGEGSAEGILKDGLITDGDTSSDEISDLFYEVKKGKYLVNISDLDEAISADVIKTDNGYAIRTQTKQVTVLTDEDAYYIDANKISDDDGYIKPVNYRGGIYADTDTLFEAFGYTASYETNPDNTIVVMTINHTGNDPYIEINPYKAESESVPETSPQVEEGAIQTEADINNPSNKEELQTVPQPTEETTEISTESTEEIKESEGESSESEVTVSETMAQIERKKEKENRKLDEEFKELWAKDKSELTDLFKGGTAEDGNVPFKQVSDNYIAFNPMDKATYYDTISVTEYPEREDERFIVATFAQDWDDLADLTPYETSKAFYRGIPAMYESTIKKLLGENAGGEFYNWLKAHADKKTMGGYIGKFDENGNLCTEWTDGEVGDGINASAISFEEWIERTSDDGLRFDVARQGDGFSITIYKN